MKCTVCGGSGITPCVPGCCPGCGGRGQAPTGDLIVRVHLDYCAALPSCVSADQAVELARVVAARHCGIDVWINGRCLVSVPSADELDDAQRAETHRGQVGQ